MLINLRLSVDLIGIMQVGKPQYPAHHLWRRRKTVFIYLKQEFNFKKSLHQHAQVCHKPLDPGPDATRCATSF